MNYPKNAIKREPEGLTVYDLMHTLIEESTGATIPHIILEPALQRRPLTILGMI